jgi:drug/metabolite transporter (DMT)-like permease
VRFVAHGYYKALGVEVLIETPRRHFGVMLTAGGMNLIGFLLFTKALQLVTAIRANLINNALTMALTVIAGIVVFAEPLNKDLAMGILLSIVGVLLITLSGSGKGEAAAQSFRQWRLLW